MTALSLDRQCELALDVERVRAILKDCRDIREIMKLRDYAEAAKRLKRVQQAGDDSAARASVIAREAEVRAGELLREMDLGRTDRGGGRPGKTSGPSGRDVSPLRDLGLTPTDSRRAHAAVAVPAEKRRAVFDAAIAKRKPLAANTLVKLAREERKARVAADLEIKPLPDPSGRFDVIVIDPPWKYGRDADITHKVRNPYPDMTLGEIKKLPVLERAERNCVLWLWVTNAFVREGYECLDVWNFQPKTILTWVKDRMGTGDWLRGKTEHCILAVRGTPTITLRNQTTVLEAPRRAHSSKPNEFFDLVEALCPGTKLEMFARKPRSGWQVWGAEAGAK
jgi:N6-adenosine-specific RNA methylase IME4